MALMSFFEDPLNYIRPSSTSRIFDLGLCDEDDLLASSCCVPSRRRRRIHHLSSPYLRHWQPLSSQRDKGSTVSCDSNKFEVNLDVQQFLPEEITVKTSGDDVITIEGKHEEKEDEHGYVSRHFVRRYTLPKGHDIEKIQSKLSSDGVLTITAPKECEDGSNEREIPIALTGKAHQTAIQNGNCDGKGENCLDRKAKAGDKNKKTIETKRK